MEQTHIQRQIESLVTSGRGYSPNYRQGIPIGIGNHVIASQVALRNMDDADGILYTNHPSNSDFFGKLGRLVSKFQVAGLPLGSITTADGLAKAMDAMDAYSLPQLILDLNKNSSRAPIPSRPSRFEENWKSLDRDSGKIPFHFEEEPLKNYFPLKIPNPKDLKLKF